MNWTILPLINSAFPSVFKRSMTVARFGVTKPVLIECLLPSS